MSAPSSMSPIRSLPADDSSANRESVLRSNARFSMPPLVGVLLGEGEETQEGGRILQHDLLF